MKKPFTRNNFYDEHYEEWSKYQREHRTGQEFVPFVLETLGGVHPLAKKLLINNCTYILKKQ